jgi:hypothetical protein
MTGAELIAQERERQIKEEGYLVEDDVIGGWWECARAAAAYAIAAADEEEADEARKIWPWSEPAWKPGTDLHNLTRAGALIAAAIDALLASDAVPDPGLMIEDAAETASDGGEM